MEVFFVLLALCLVFCLLVVMPVLVLVRVSAALEELRALTGRFRNLEARLARGERPVRPDEPAEPAAPLVAPLPVPVTSAEPPPRVEPGSPPPAPPPAEPLCARAEPERAAEPPPPAEPSTAEQVLGAVWNWLVIGEAYRKPGVSWEYAVATNWLLRAGILTVLAGVAFFLKYSIEKGLMGPLGRVALSLAAGLGLIVFGVRLLFRRYHLLGQGLAGAGVVTLYFSFYAASMMYKLVGQAPAFALMAAVTAAAGALAVLYRTPMIAVLGLVGGYATPVMLSEGGDHELFFYGYMLLLSCGVLGVSLVRRWPALNVLGMFAAYTLVFLFCERHPGAEHAWRGLVFLSAVHLLYLFSVALSRLCLRQRTTAVEWLALLSNAGLYWFWVLALFKPAFGKAETGLVALALCAVYVALVYGCFARKSDDRALLDLLLALAAVFLAMSPVLLLAGEWLVLAWCLQALAMAWLARRGGSPLLGQLAVALFALACARGLFFDLHRLYDTLAPAALRGAAFWKAAGVRLLSFGALPASLLAARRFAWGGAARSTLWRLTLGLALLQAWLYVTLETGVLVRVYAPAFRHSSVTVVWTLFAFALLFAGLRLRGAWLRGCGLALFVVAVVKLLAADLAGLDTLYRIVAFISVGVLLVLGAFVYLKYRVLFEPEAEAGGEATLPH